MEYVIDQYTAGEILADQTGAENVLTFTFSYKMDLVWVRCDGGTGRADPFGGTPTNTLGIICEDGVPNSLTILTKTVKIFADTGVNVSVWGYRYGPIPSSLTGT